jgi:hypothetical protein
MVDLQELPRVIEDLRHHTPEQLAELRLLLNVGLDRADTRRTGFFEIDGAANVYYVLRYPFRHKFCSWPPGTVKANPWWNSWCALKRQPKEIAANTRCL